MHRIPSTPARLFRVGRLVVRIGLLSLYLVTATPLAPALTALLALADGAHQVALQQSAGGVQVVLHHECVRSAAHRHGMVARTLTLFAQRTAGAQLDHVIQFGSANFMSPAPMVAVAPSTQMPALDAFPSGLCRLEAPSLGLFLATCPRPPPAASGLLRSVRSTVLLL